MRMYELISGRQKRQELGQMTRAGAVHDISDLQKGLGFKPLQSGYYATVLVHPKYDYIVKLFDTRDLAYPVFLNIARRHADNPHFPRFRGRPVDFGQWVGVRMEKLWPYPLSKFEEIEHMLDSSGWYDNWRDTIGDDSIEADFLERWPEFATALDALRAGLKTATGIRSDWHQGNIMQRADGTPVIIDPFAPRA